MSVGERVEAAGTVPVASVDVPADAILIRAPEEVARAAGRRELEGAAEVLNRWRDYERRALVVVLAGSQPDAGYRLEVLAVELDDHLLRVRGRVLRREGLAAQVISVPWVVLSIDARAASQATRCHLDLIADPPP